LSVDTEARASSIGFNDLDDTERAYEGLPPALQQRVRGGSMQLVSFDGLREDGWDSSVQQIFEEELDRIRTDFTETFGYLLHLTDAQLEELQEHARACHDVRAVQNLLEQELTRPAIQAMLTGERERSGMVLTPVEPSAP